MSQAAVDDLIELLNLESIEVNIFRGISPKDDRQRVFGGQVAGQALVAAALDRPQAIDTRIADWSPADRAESLPPHQHVWLRADGKLPDDTLLHTIVLTYASDMTLLDTTLLPHGGSWFDTGLQMASLDHAMWFHRRFRADRWLLYSQDTPAASNSRGLARGLVFTEEGMLVASVVQEGLIRVVNR